MVEGGLYTFAVPIGRTIAGFFVGLILGIVGGWIAITFNHMIEFPWSLEVHRNIYLVGVGLGGGIGAYLAWMNLSVRWYLVLGIMLLVLIGGILGAYLGYAYGQIAEPSYLGRRYTVDNMLHFGAAVGGIVVATALGLIWEIRSMGR